MKDRKDKNKFWTLFVGKEWDINVVDFHTGMHLITHPDFYHDLSGFQIVKEHIEKEMNTVWEDYIWHVLDDGLLRLQDQVNQLLSLDNLLDYLLENTEKWGYTFGITEKTVEKHPALLFAEGKEE